jgi:glutaredoxin
MELKLYYYNQCPFCRIVTSKIQQLGLEGKITFCNTLESQEHAQFHMQQTGRNTVPCLYIDGKPMFESRDIAAWLEKNKDQIIQG